MCTVVLRYQIILLIFSTLALEVLQYQCWKYEWIWMNKYWRIWMNRSHKYTKTKTNKQTNKQKVHWNHCISCGIYCMNWQYSVSIFQTISADNAGIGWKAQVSVLIFKPLCLLISRFALVFLTHLAYPPKLCLCYQPVLLYYSDITWASWVRLKSKNFETTSRRLSFLNMVLTSKLGPGHARMQLRWDVWCLYKIYHQQSIVIGLLSVSLNNLSCHAIK